MAGRGKGTLLVNLRSFVSQVRGEDGWNALVRRASPSDRDILTRPLLVSSWYPVGTYNRAVSAFLADQPSAQESMTAFARHVASRDLNSVMRFILSLASPEGIVRRSSMFWSRYFDTGTCTARELGAGRWIVELNAPRAEDEAAGEHTCRWGIGGWLSQGVVLAGAKRASFDHPRCRFRNAPSCATEIVWS